jgi:UDPglucose 6-dehydrogenase
MDNAVVIGGLGVVGGATRDLFNIPDYFDKRGSTLNLEEVAKKKYVFICLPTKPNKDGYDIEDIYELIKQINQYPHSEKLYIIRSTVIPGTTDALITRLGLENIIYNPEFLTMSTIDDDTHRPDIVVIGSERAEWSLELANLYKDHLKNSPQFFMTGTKEAEMIKLAINVFYTTKVVFANQIFDLCMKLNINYDQVKRAMYARKWIGDNHLDVWHNNKRGAGGMCLPKDLKAFNNKFELPLFQMVEQLNEALLGDHATK